MKVEQGRPVLEGFHTKVDYLSGAHVGRTVAVVDTRASVVWRGVLTQYSALLLSTGTTFSLTIRLDAGGEVHLERLSAGTGVLIHQTGWRD